MFAAGATGPLMRLTPISTCKIFKVCNDRTARGAGGGLDLARGGLTFGREVLACQMLAPGGLDLAPPGTVLSIRTSTSTTCTSSAGIQVFSFGPCCEPAASECTDAV